MRFASATSLLLLIVLMAPAAAQQPVPLAEGLAPLAPLLGCWRGRFADSELIDERCLEPMLGGAHVRDVHRVVGTGYRGETVYSVDAAAGGIVYTYYNVAGTAMRGTLLAEAPGTIRAASGDGAMTVEWRFEADRWSQRTLENGTERMRIDFVRVPEAELGQALGMRATAPAQ